MDSSFPHSVAASMNETSNSSGDDDLPQAASLHHDASASYLEHSEDDGPLDPLSLVFIVSASLAAAVLIAWVCCRFRPSLWRWWWTPRRSSRGTSPRTPILREERTPSSVSSSSAYRTNDRPVDHKGQQGQEYKEPDEEKVQEEQRRPLTFQERLAQNKANLDRRTWEYKIAGELRTQQRSYRLPLKLEQVFEGGVHTEVVNIEFKSPDGRFCKNVEKRFTIPLEPGIQAGTKIAFDDRSKLVPLDAQPQPNFIFTVEDVEHDQFQRDKHDLIHKARIDLLDAMFGFQLRVPLFGEARQTRTITSRGLAKVSEEHRLRGLGLPKGTRSQPSRDRGDIRVRFQVVFPERLSAEQKSALARLLP